MSSTAIPKNTKADWLRYIKRLVRLYVNYHGSFRTTAAEAYFKGVAIRTIATNPKVRSPAQETLTETHVNAAPWDRTMHEFHLWDAKKIPLESLNMAKLEAIYNNAYEKVSETVGKHLYEIEERARKEARYQDLIETELTNIMREETK